MVSKSVKFPTLSIRFLRVSTWLYKSDGCMLVGVVLDLDVVAIPVAFGLFFAFKGLLMAASIPPGRRRVATSLSALLETAAAAAPQTY